LSLSHRCKEDKLMIMGGKLHRLAAFK